MKPCVKTTKQCNNFKGCDLQYRREGNKRRLEEKLADKAEIARLKKKCGEK